MSVVFPESSGMFRGKDPALASLSRSTGQCLLLSLELDNLEIVMGPLYYISVLYEGLF